MAKGKILTFNNKWTFLHRYFWNSDMKNTSCLQHVLGWFLLCISCACSRLLDAVKSRCMGQGVFIERVSTQKKVSADRFIHKNSAHMYVGKCTKILRTCVTSCLHIFISIRVWFNYIIQIYHAWETLVKTMGLRWLKSHYFPKDAAPREKVRF